MWGTSHLIRLTLVACADDPVIGAGTLFESTIHPRWLFVIMNVTPAWQRRDVGTRLYSALADLADACPWQAKMTRRDQAGGAFLIRRGFRPVVQILTLTLARHFAALGMRRVAAPDRWEVSFF